MNEDTHQEPPKQPLNPHAKGFRHGCLAGCLFMIVGWFVSIIGLSMIAAYQLADGQYDPDASFQMGSEIGRLFAWPVFFCLCLGSMIVFYIFYKRAMRKR